MAGLSELVVLAGGHGRRMGLAKVLLHRHGRPVLEELLDRLAWEGPVSLAIAAGQEPPSGASRVDRVLTDAADSEGPLAGLLVALRTTQAPSLLVIPIDMPNLSRVHLLESASLIDQLPEAQAIMWKGVGGQIEPMPLAIRRSSLPLVEAYAASRRRSLHGLIEFDRRFVLTDPPTSFGPDTFANVNTPQDAERFGYTMP